MADKEFMDEMNKVYTKFQSYMEEKSQNSPNPSVAYFSMGMDLQMCLRFTQEV